ncbi:hypothetical protein [Hoylesella shahii]|uniref:hypothetical protein n=1 Tax=Hoylesella shahii TaxID=228603 RepID=UPI0011B64108|nr:hypothetical protein [Hoylesella shahii]
MTYKRAFYKHIATKTTKTKSKRQRNLQQNAVHLAAKRSAICSKTQGVLLLNARRFAAYYRTKR